VTGRTPLDEQLLRELADGDLSRIGGLIHDRVDAQKASGLEDETFRVAEIAALAALDAPLISWYMHLGTDPPDTDTIVGALIAVAPIIGAPRVVSAASNIVTATEPLEQVDEDI
jgi:hypothetical protein